MMDMTNLSLMRFMAAALLAVAPQADAFSAQSIVSSPQVAALHQPIFNRHFQLEELEHSEASTTDVLLNADLSVTLGGTNGPLCSAATGTWAESCQYFNDGQLEGDDFKRYFEMKLSRTFISTGCAGGHLGDTTNIGEFEYSVERTYVGECFLVGGRVFAMNGEILDVDEIFGERRVGFFNMIDTTEERERNAMMEP